MSGSGRLSSARFDGGDRFYSPPAVRKHQQELLQRQRQQLKQQNPQQQQLPVRVIKSKVSTAEVESRTESDDSTLSKPSVCSSPSPRFSNCTNLDRFLESTTPLVLAQRLSKTSLRGLRNGDGKCDMYFNLGDLWESFKEWSAYGAGVPLVLNESDFVVQYYVPYLSAIQLYVNPSTPSWSLRQPGEDSDVESFRETSSSDEGVDCNPTLPPKFQYLEKDSPYSREPLADKISILASQFPELKMYNSCDLLPSSWISVAWYPIYRIPTGPTLRDLDACFLTFHSLATPVTCSRNGQPDVCDSSYRDVHAALDPSTKVSLPAFGLASYKFKGSVWSPSGHAESQQASSLLQAADNWLRRLQVYHPDYRFFMSHSSFQR